MILKTWKNYLLEQVPHWSYDTEYNQSFHGVNFFNIKNLRLTLGNNYKHTLRGVDFGNITNMQLYGNNNVDLRGAIMDNIEYLVLSRTYCDNQNSINNFIEDLKSIKHIEIFINHNKICQKWDFLLNKHIPKITIKTHEDYCGSNATLKIIIENK